MDLRAGCRRGTTPSNSPGYPKTQGCSLREIERKIGWSVGTDHHKKMRKTDLKVGCSPTATTANSPGCPKMQGCSLHKIGQKIGWSCGTDHPPKREKWTCKLVLIEEQLPQIPQVSQRIRDAAVCILFKLI